MKYFIFCVLGMLVFSCSREQSQNEVIDISIDIFVENSVGESLLKMTTPNAINPDSIKLIYLISGNMFSVYNSNMDCPRNICYITDSGSERIRVFPNNAESEEYPVTYISWGNGDMDTLKCHFIREDNGSYSIVCDKVWFNDLLMFPDSAVSGFGRAFKIVK